MNSDMENRDWINNYMSLKQVNANNPFTVPDGYFDNLGERIAAYKNLVELKNKGVTEGFTLPENYFEELSGNIQSRIAVEEALTGDAGFTLPGNYFEQLSGNIQSRIAVEEALTGDTGFTLPENYFEKLSENIKSRIAIDEVLNADAGFTTPEGYFDSLTQQIQSRVFVEEALAESEQSFTVPANYFNKLNESILNKTVKVDEAKQGGVIRRLVATTAFKYATAACFALVLGGGILLNELSSSVTEHSKTFLHKQLAGVPVDEIQSYLQLNDDATEVQQTVVSQGTKVDDKELNDALQKDIDSVQ